MASPLTNLWRWLNQPIYDERNLPANLFGIAVEGSDSTDTAGVTVDQDTAMRLSAVWSAIRLLSHDIGSLPIDPYRKRAGRREVIDPPPSWIDLPIVRDPSVTSVDHFSQVVAAMLRDGNDFTLAFPSVVNPAELHILEPEKVEISRKANGEPVYKDHDSGKVFSPDQIIHIPLFRKPGALRGMSPIEAMKTGIGRGMAAEEMGSRFFSRGSQLGGVVEYPLEAGEVKKEQVQELLRGLNKRHRGIRNAWALGALTQGAKFHELQMKPSDSQLIETEEWTLEQIARAYGVPPSMLGSQKPGAVAYASVEQRSIDYVVHGVLPITIRIEKAYSRLLPRGSYIKFNVGGLLRGDARSRWEQYQIALQNKVMTRDEVRILEDMEPVGGEDGDFLETPNNNPPDQGVANASPA